MKKGRGLAVPPFFVRAFRRGADQAALAMSAAMIVAESVIVAP